MMLENQKECRERTTDLTEGDVKVNAKDISRHNTLTMYFLVAIISLISVPSTRATITVFSESSNKTVNKFDDAPASFVPDRVASYGLEGYAVYATPPNACSPVLSPIIEPGDLDMNWILVAARNGCNFQTKIENAQAAGYSAIIVHNVGSNSTAAMGVDHPSSLFIYACFIGEYYGNLLRLNYSYSHDKGKDKYLIQIHDDFSLNGYLLPFAIVVGVCFIIMLIFMVRLLWQQVARCLAERRRDRRRKLPSSALKKLPVKKWTKGDPYETCAICLEDFVEQDKIRVLPCAHAYHTVCIDPWLTKGRRVCPVCKRKVILAEERIPPADSDTDDDNAPLLGTASTSTASAPVTSDSFTNFLISRGFRPARTSHRSASNNRSDSDSVSSEEGTGSETIRSLPVMAQVHSLSVEVTNEHQTRPPPADAASSASQSQFYVSCEDREESDEDEELLDVSTHSASPLPSISHSSNHQTETDDDDEPLIAVIDGEERRSNPSAIV